MSWKPAQLITATLFALAPGVSAIAEITTDPLATQPGFELGGQVSNYEYQEPSLDVKISGTKWGITAAYTFNNGREIPYVKFDLRYASGSLKYEGSGTMTGVPDKNTEIRMLIGRDFFPRGRYGLSPYIGLGYRYLYNDIRGTSSTGAVGYRRYSEYRYLPIGIAARFPAGPSWVVAPTVEFDVFLSGTQKSKLTDTGIGFSDATNDQGGGYGYRCSVFFQKGQIAFGPWMHYWNINKSDEADIGFGYVAFEPKNWTREFGAEFKYRF